MGLTAHLGGFEGDYVEDGAVSAEEGVEAEAEVGFAEGGEGGAGAWGVGGDVEPGDWG